MRPKTRFDDLDWRRAPDRPPLRVRPGRGHHGHAAQLMLLFLDGLPRTHDEICRAMAAGTPSRFLDELGQALSDGNLEVANAPKAALAPESDGEGTSRPGRERQSGEMRLIRRAAGLQKAKGSDGAV